MSISNIDEVEMSKRASSVAQAEGKQIPRASKACVGCRKQKTRCFPSSDRVECLRCVSLGRTCSFLTDIETEDVFGSHKRQQVESVAMSEVPSMSSVSSVATPSLLMIEDNVKKILSILESSSPYTPAAPQVPSIDEDNDDSLHAYSIDSSFRKKSFKSSPIMTIHNSVSDKNKPISIKQILSSLTPGLENKHGNDTDEPQDLISMGILTMEQVESLVNNFKDCYSRWISLPNFNSTIELIEDIRRSSSLLLAVICCTSLRYINHPIKETPTYKTLLRHLKEEYLKSLSNSCTNSQSNNKKNLNYLKALVILSVYGYSLSSDEFVIDPWFISGIAIKEFLTIDIKNSLLDLKVLKNLNNSTNNKELELQEFTKLSNFRIWNHICLVHLVNCVFSNRMCILDEIRLDQSRNSLDLTTTTNFDGRMISEMSLQLLVYNYLQSNPKDFEIFEMDIKNWYEQWNYLFRQPTLQFVEFGYHYAYIVAINHWVSYLKKDTDDDAQEDTQEEEVEIKDVKVLNRLIYHCLKIVEFLTIEIKDDLFFLCLSDQIHLCSVYVCLLFLKLIKWNQKLSVMTNNSGNSFSSEQIIGFIDRIRIIMNRFKAISLNKDDLINKYGNSLEDSLIKFHKEMSLPYLF